MGGFGSGRRWDKRTTVEECHSLSVGTFRDALHYAPGWGGSIYWTVGGRKTGSMSFRTVPWHGDGLAVRLVYTITRYTGEKTDYDYPVVMQVTRPYFGGVRWWFTCPLLANGVACGRRVYKLYLPPGGRYFGCRHCYDLTYRSCQESDKRVSFYWRNPEAMLAALRAMREGGETNFSELLTLLKAWTPDL